MATRSHIGLLNEDKTVSFVYCHYDGYPSWVGKILKENYDRPEDVFNLLSFGDLSILRDTIEDSVFYKRDKNETDVDQTQTTLEKFITKSPGIDFKYLYDTETEEWSCRDWVGTLIKIPTEDIDIIR
jgi:hypothetical protein